LINKLSDEGIVPVIAPIAVGANGETYSVRDGVPRWKTDAGMRVQSRERRITDTEARYTPGGRP
jgi:hypothetical protein